MKQLTLIITILIAGLSSLFSQQSTRNIPFTWDNATVYFMLTDRFYNGDTSNDGAYGRQKNTKNHEMDFQGGDLKGLTAKINEGYFDKLGVNAIWITAFYEQMHKGVGEFNYYGYHGYFTKDWSQMDKAMGSEADLREMVDAAHNHGIRIILDVVMNHSGYPIDGDGGYPLSWVRNNYEGYGDKVIYEPLAGLPDMRTEATTSVELPQWLIDKWQSEGVKDKELNELNTFFSRTGKTRSVRNFLIKWLSDWVREFGIDGFRCDTAKHITVEGWKDLKTECVAALKEWKANNPTKKLDDLDFWMTGEVFGQSVWDGKNYYFDNGFDNIINFSYVGDVNNSYESTFSSYSDKINKVSGFNTLSYIASHDVAPSGARSNTWLAGTKMMLTPGAIQIYYGDESKRPFFGAQTYTDQGYRSFMNWDDINSNQDVKNNLEHWQKLGVFRREHSAVGAGLHTKRSDSPYTFTRSGGKAINGDAVVAVLDIAGSHTSVTLSAYGLWPDGTVIKDYYSNTTATVTGGNLTFQTTAAYVLAGKPGESVKLTITPDAGWYNPSTSVSMSAVSSSAGATTSIYYTLDGTTPTASSPLYNSPIAITQSKTLKAIAIDSKGNSSQVESRTYNIGIEPPTLTILPASGVFENGTGITVTFTATDKTDGAPKIYYTVDGSIPTVSSTAYTAPFQISGTNQIITVKAIAKNSQNAVSEVVTATYEFKVLPKGLVVYFKKPVSWAGVNIHYWNCTPATVLATTWPGNPMELAANGYYKYTIVGATKASIVFNNTSNSSDKTTNQVDVTKNPAYYENGVWSDTPTSDAVVTVSPDGGTFATSTQVTLSATGTATPLTIRYTLDGTPPTATTGNVYSTPFTLTSNKTVKAIAIDALGGTSAVVSKTFTVGIQPTLKVHVKVTGQTAAPYLYVWTPEHNGAWPGKQITGSADGDGFFTYTFPDGVTSSNMIINLGQGKNQSADIMNVSQESYFIWDGGAKTTPNIATSLSNQVEIDVQSAPYPNPFTSSLSIKPIDESETIIVGIYSIMGEQLFAESFNHPTDVITITPELSKGAYIMRVTTQTATSSYKIIKR